MSICTGGNISSVPPEGQRCPLTENKSFRYRPNFMLEQKVIFIWNFGQKLQKNKFFSSKFATGGGVYNTKHFSEGLVLFHEFLSDSFYKSDSRLEISEWMVIKSKSAKIVFYRIRKKSRWKFSSDWSYSSHSRTNFLRVIGFIATHDSGLIATHVSGIIDNPLYKKVHSGLPLSKSRTRTLSASISSGAITIPVPWFFPNLWAFNNYAKWVGRAICLVGRR